MGFRLPSRIPIDTCYSRTSFKYRPPKQKPTAIRRRRHPGYRSGDGLGRDRAKDGKSVSELFGLINGTSTGGIFTLGLAEPATGGQEPQYKAEELADLYEKEGDRIFSRSV